ncbi:hypothetical protein AB0D14_02045 [Streptomyces sp. NPDC048484]|uniref:hypothetical protein n=1 Tax=Streptomyces sp. NPDC048484 TaxID=3155146 RepID=UPI00343B5A29
MPNHPSVIARPDGDGFAGRYVHNDGHPHTRLPLLRELYAGPFRGDLEALQHFLIDDHPAGWSQLGHTPAVDTGWDNSRSGIGYSHFVCFCHGDRHDAPLLCTQADTDAGTADWVYVLKPDGIEVLHDVSEEGDAAWRLAILSPWAEVAGTPEPWTFEEIMEVDAGLSPMYRAVVQVEQQNPAEFPIIIGLKAWALLDGEQQRDSFKSLVQAYVDVVQHQRDGRAIR